MPRPLRLREARYPVLPEKLVKNGEAGLIKLSAS